MFTTVLNHPRLPVRFAQQLGFGFAFWLFFLLILQSGNAARSASLAFSEEATRILAASALGSFTALLLVPLSSKFPLHGPRWATHFALAIAGSVIVAAVLVLVAWAAAPLVLSPDNPRLSAPLAYQFAADAPLLTFAILGFVLLLNLPSPQPFVRTQEPSEDAFVIRTRYGLIRIGPAEIDWAEAQENYVALHCGPDTHLVRETLTAIAERLDPHAFIRIHRRMIVNRGRLRGLRPLPGGDAMAILDTGAELRVSRTYAGQVRALIG